MFDLSLDSVCGALESIICSNASLAHLHPCVCKFIVRSSARNQPIHHLWHA
jgi:hypothetical protein